MRTPTAPLGIDIDLTYDYLEERFEDDCVCESTHPETVCTVEVVARKSCCDRAFLICASAYKWNLLVLSLGYGKCDGCGQATADCWKLVLL